MPAEDAELRLGEGDEGAVVVDEVDSPVHDSALRPGEPFVQEPWNQEAEPQKGKRMT